MLSPFNWKSRRRDRPRDVDSTHALEGFEVLGIEEGGEMERLECERGGVDVLVLSKIQFHLLPSSSSSSPPSGVPSVSPLAFFLVPLSEVEPMCVGVDELRVPKRSNRGDV